MTLTLMKKQKIKKLGWEYLKTWMEIFRVALFGREFSRGKFDG